MSSTKQNNWPVKFIEFIDCVRVHSVMSVFSTHLCDLLPLSPSLWFNSPAFPLHLPPSSLCVHVQYSTCTVHVTVCVGGYVVLGLRQINTCREVPLQVKFFRWQHFAFPSISLTFLRPQWRRKYNVWAWSWNICKLKSPKVFHRIESWKERHF